MQPGDDAVFFHPEVGPRGADAGPPAPQPQVADMGVQQPAQRQAELGAGELHFGVGNVLGDGGVELGGDLGRKALQHGARDRRGDERGQGAADRQPQQSRRPSCRGGIHNCEL